jgi:hypothetical protein
MSCLACSSHRLSYHHIVRSDSTILLLVLAISRRTPGSRGGRTMSCRMTGVSRGVSSQGQGRLLSSAHMHLHLHLPVPSSRMRMASTARSAPLWQHPPQSMRRGYDGRGNSSSSLGGLGRGKTGRGEVVIVVRVCVCACHPMGVGMRWRKGRVWVRVGVRRWRRVKGWG